MNAWLYEDPFPSARLAPPCSLRAQGPNGTMITGEVHLTNVDRRITGSATTLDVRAEATPLRVGYPTPAPEPGAGHTLEYKTTGMHGYGLAVAPTSLGLLSITGTPAAITDYSELHGALRLRTDTPPLDWVEKADALARDVLNVFSLAQGHLIRWSIREYYRGTNLAEVLCSGPHLTSSPYEPLFSHLDPQPLLDLAARAYTSGRSKSTGVPVALEWFLMNPPYAEMKVVAASTALEHLVATHSSKKGNTIIPTKMFTEHFLPVLRGAFDTVVWDQLLEATTATQLAELRNKLSSLNYNSFGARLENMLTEYAVPTWGLEDAIQEVIKLRNRIVHQGLTSSTPEELIRLVAVVRELLKRLFLTLLDYKGQYQSFLDGPHWVPFPPVESTAVAQPA